MTWGKKLTLFYKKYINKIGYSLYKKKKDPKNQSAFLSLSFPSNRQNV